MQTCAIFLQELLEGVLENPHAREPDECDNPVNLVSRENIHVYLVLHREIMVASGEKGIYSET